MNIKTGWRGRLYEDFEVGDVPRRCRRHRSRRRHAGKREGFRSNFPVERYYRDAPLLVIGGGTNELQRLIIARQLLQKYSIA